MFQFFLFFIFLKDLWFITATCDHNIQQYFTDISECSKVIITLLQFLNSSIRHRVISDLCWLFLNKTYIIPPRTEVRLCFNADTQITSFSWCFVENNVNLLVCSICLCALYILRCFEKPTHDAFSVMHIQIY